MVISVFHMYEGEKIGDKIVKGKSITHKRAEKEFGLNLKVQDSTIPVYARIIANKLNKPVIIMERRTKQTYAYYGEKIVVKCPEEGSQKCFKIILPGSGTVPCDVLEIS
jgi:hypothetical protein